MCGYIRRSGPKSVIKAWLKQFGLDEVWDDQQPHMPQVPIESFYPAFGRVASKQIKQLIIKQDHEVKAVDATWWFDCKEEDGKLIVGSRTTFNARNLASPYWKAAVRHNRAIVVATGLGESKEVLGKKLQYLMEAQEPVLLGAVYRSFPSDLYSTAVITRDAHPRFDKYHDKAFPLFLPNDRKFLELWLSDAPESHPEIAHLLENPKIFTDLQVTQVKTFKDGVAIGSPVPLIADELVG